MKCKTPAGHIDASDCGASGSEFKTVGAITAGSNVIRVDDVGDFRVGQEVEVSHCHLHHYGTVYAAGKPALAGSQHKLEGEVELSGLDDAKPWQTFVIHFDATDPVTFRWMAVDPAYQTMVRHEPVTFREWVWQGTGVPISGDWLPLLDGVRMRFRKRDWEPGQCISFHARNRLLASITGISGKMLTLSAPATRDAVSAEIRHHDQSALQTAVDMAIADRKNLFIPAGRYRLSSGLWIRNASLGIEGAHREHTLLDISGDNTAVFWISGGKDVSVRNLAMLGHTGFMELPADHSFPTVQGSAFWPTANQQMEVKGCAAANIVSTEHLLFEDLKVSRMVSEAFYLHGADRLGNPPFIQAPHEGMHELARQYTKSCIFHRCHVSDCGFNAFNNNDFAENTSILHCHVERVHNFCEGAGRFIRIIGNYVLDGCATSIHSCSRAWPLKLGPCQAVISDNVFEGGAISGGISIGNAATQVVISNNLFIGYSKESAITVFAGTRGSPVRTVNITGNIVDLTRLGDNPEHDRVGIAVSASNVVVANNQIYVRGSKTGNVTAIHVSDHAVNIHVHDNIVENCDWGFRTGSRVYVVDDGKGRFEYRHTESEVGEVLGSGLFRDRKLPGGWDEVPAYCGWHIKWLSGANAGVTTTIEGFTTKERIMRLKEPLQLQTGDRFALYPAKMNWQIHNNTIENCTHPFTVDLLVTEGVQIKDNLLG